MTCWLEITSSGRTRKWDGVGKRRADRGADRAERLREKMAIPKLFVVLPAYNEAENLRPLLSSLEMICDCLGRAGHGHQYVIVDDGSSDDTPEILSELKAELPITVITHSPNQGLGATIRDGLERASELADEQDIIIAMDADNSHPAGLMIAMTRSILEGSDIVIASRYRSRARIYGLAR